MAGFDPMSTMERHTSHRLAAGSTRGPNVFEVCRAVHEKVNPVALSFVAVVKQGGEGICRRGGGGHSGAAGSLLGTVPNSASEGRPGCVEPGCCGETGR